MKYNERELKKSKIWSILAVTISAYYASSWLHLKLFILERNIKFNFETLKHNQEMDIIRVYTKLWKIFLQKNGIVSPFDSISAHCVSSRLPLNLFLFSNKY